MPAKKPAPGKTGSRLHGRSPRATDGTQRKRLDGGALVAQLNEMVAQLIKENRRLKQQVLKLSERASSARTRSGKPSSVRRASRSGLRRTQRTVKAKPNRKATAPAKARRKPVGSKPARRKPKAR
jgi:hypothetical protein